MKLISTLIVLFFTSIISVYPSDILVENVDYTLSYKNNVNPGVATILINGIGKYYGQLTTTFIIYKYGFFYTGKEICPKVKLTLNSKELVEHTDYELSYKDNINVGTAQIIITGKGNFNNIKIMQFQIIPADNSNQQSTELQNEHQVISISLNE